MVVRFIKRQLIPPVRNVLYFRDDFPWIGDQQLRMLVYRTYDAFDVRASEALHRTNPADLRNEKSRREEGQ